MDLERGSAISQCMDNSLRTEHGIVARQTTQGMV
jgi:hypothetical protein